MKKKQELQQKLSVRADYRKFKWLYWMILPIIIYYAVFMYIPMFGQVIAFQDYRPARGIGGSEWVGLENFVDFFKSPFAWRVIRNTIIISVNEIIFGFPAPIILALLINEMSCRRYKRVLQTGVILIKWTKKRKGIKRIIDKGTEGKYKWHMC